MREPPTGTNAEWHRQKMLWEFREGRGQQSIREDFLEEVRRLLTWKDGDVWRCKPKAAEQARKHKTAVKPIGLKLRLCVEDGDVKDPVMERMRGFGKCILVRRPWASQESTFSCHPSTGLRSEAFSCLQLPLAFLPLARYGVSGTLTRGAHSHPLQPCAVEEGTVSLRLEGEGCAEC